MIAHAYTLRSGQEEVAVRRPPGGNSRADVRRQTGHWPTEWADQGAGAVDAIPSVRYGQPADAGALVQHCGVAAVQAGADVALAQGRVGAAVGGTGVIFLVYFCCFLLLITWYVRA